MLSICSRSARVIKFHYNLTLRSYYLLTRKPFDEPVFLHFLTELPFSDCKPVTYKQVYLEKSSILHILKRSSCYFLFLYWQISHLTNIITVNVYMNGCLLLISGTAQKIDRSLAEITRCKTYFRNTWATN